MLLSEFEPFFTIGKALNALAREGESLAEKRKFVISGWSKFMDTSAENSEALQLSADVIPHMVWMARPDGFIEYFNQRTLDYAGLAAEELYGWGWLRLIHPDDGSVAEQTWGRALRGGGGYAAEYRIRKKDGKHYWHQIRALAVRDSNGQIRKWVGTWTDIEEFKLAQRGMRELAAIVESSDDAIIGKTLEGIVTSWNQGAEHLFGYSAEEMIGQSVLRLIPEDRLEEEAQILARLRSGERVDHYETMRRRKDGQLVDVSLSISPIRDGGERLVGASKIARDITERKKGEEALSRSEGRLRALAARLQRAREEEAIRIARELHDQLGRCLTTIKMDITLIEQMARGQLTAETVRSISEKTQLIVEAIDETVHLVRKISTELRPGILDDLGLAAAIEWQANDFQRRSGVLCVISVTEEDLGLSREQATAFFRIFQEIITNVARHSKALKVWVHLEVRDGMVALEVEDNGVGISPEALVQPHALGLLGMRERAAVFGGEVEIAGTPGKGTTIVVRMPIGEPTHENSDR